MTIPTIANAPVSLRDFIEGACGLELDGEGLYAITNYDAYLLNIILRLTAEDNLVTDNSEENQLALASLNADLAVLNGELTDKERGCALSQIGLWAQTEQWVEGVADRLSNTINACRVNV